MPPTLLAGVASVDISPPKGIGLAGYPHHERHNTGVHDPLMAACLYLNGGGTSLAMVCTDLLILGKQEVRKVRETVHAATGIPPSHIMITASHSHSAPRAAGRVDLEGLESGKEPDAAYLAGVREKLAALVGQAQGSAFEARVGIEKGFCGREHGVGGNRRDPMGIADPEVWTIGVQDAAGTWRGCLVKYALHPTLLHSDNVLVSADYPGYMRQYFARHLPGAVFLFAQGCSGNQSSRYFRSGQTFAEADRIGSAIAAQARRVLEKMEPRSDVSLGARSEEVEIPLRTLPPLAQAEAATETARRAWEARKAEGASYQDTWNAELRLLGAENTLGFVRRKEQGKPFPFLQDEMPVEVQVLSIGAARIVGIQGELFVEWALDIQHRAPFSKCFVVELANGGLPGYGCTARAYAAGGYEAGASLLTAESCEVLVQTAVRLLREAP